MTQDDIFQKVAQGFRGWKILRRIGEGASAVVYLAERNGERRALKVFRSWVTQEFSASVQTTRIERQLALRGHNHPHLVTVFDGGFDDKTNLYYLFMEFLDQQPLSQFISRVPVERIAPLVAQVASAAKFLEDAGFTHRDIKPDNIVVDLEFRRATLLDVGVLLPLSGSTLTDQGSERRVFLGTTRWSPPEFIKREEVTTIDGYRAITFYQLGAVLHDLLTGERMFAEVKDEPKANLIDAVLNKVPDFSKLRPGVGVELSLLAETCLKKEPGARLKRVTWDSFSYVRLRRRPVVVLLYTGGTIGAEVAADSSHIRDFHPIDSPADPYLINFRNKIESDYRFLFGPSAPMPFDLEWEVLPPHEQLLSENADAQTWRNLGRALERIFAKYIPPVLDDSAQPTGTDQGSTLRAGGTSATFGERIYLVGVVVLHGTDTLAFSAAALAVACQNLPCPVVITGSNQPPRMEDVRERDAIANQSDAWKNVRRGLVFLQTLGHRFTETFVCFGDTVHTGINIRSPAGSSTSSSATSRTAPRSSPRRSTSAPCRSASTPSPTA